jgi:hypothetical protein
MAAMKKFCLLVFLLGIVILSAQNAAAYLYVSRIGDGTTTGFTNSGADGAPVFIDKYTDGGSLLSSIAMPIAPFSGTAGTNHPFVLPPASTSIGHLALSTDGNYLTLGGDDAIPGTATVRQTTAGRVIGRVTLSNGAVDTTTSLTDAYPGSTNNNNDMRGVVTTDGTEFWTSGTSFPTATNTNAGVHYALLGATTSVRLDPGSSSGTLSNARVANIYNGQLYVTSGSGGFLGINTPGTGLPRPTLNDQSSPTLVVPTSVSGTGTASPYDFWFKDANTVYVADDRAGTVLTNGSLGGGIQKWEFNGSSWLLDYTLKLAAGADGIRGLDGTIVGGNAVLYATTGTAGVGAQAVLPDSLVTITDTGTGLDTFTSLAASGTNKIFRGVVFVPTPACAPGDLNCDGHEDAGDYAYWRKTSGPPGDYTLWRQNFGSPPGAGSGGGLSGGAVPEPASAVLFLLGIAAMGSRRRRT